jgi:hypothetical protein
MRFMSLRPPWMAGVPRMQDAIRGRPLARLAAIVLAVGSGCSALDGAGFAPKYDPYKLYLTTPAPVRIRSEYIDRYACAAETPLACECLGRISGECTCRC